MRLISTVLVAAATTTLRVVTALPLPLPLPLPQLSHLARGRCTFPGQFVCVSATTFALCDASLGGIIQPLAAGDSRCLPPPPSSGTELSRVPAGTSTTTKTAAAEGGSIAVVPTTCPGCTLVVPA
jgi:hypothetical protein